jgi:rRNA-processing protein FCF1
MFKKTVPKTVPSAVELKNIKEREREKEREERIEEEMERLENAEHPNMPLTMEDILHFGFDENVLERALENVNVMILTRLIREKYPHKFE